MSVLSPEQWMLGPYGSFPRMEGPPRLPEEVVRDLLLRAAPRAVVGRHTASYLHQGSSVDEATFFVTSGADGMSQAAAPLFQLQERPQEGDVPVVLGLGLGGSEVRALRAAVELAGGRAMVINFALKRMGDGERPHSAVVVALAMKQWGTRATQE